MVGKTILECIMVLPKFTRVVDYKAGLQVGNRYNHVNAKHSAWLQGKARVESRCSFFFVHLFVWLQYRYPTRVIYILLCCKNFL